MSGHNIVIVEDDPFQQAILARLIGFVSDAEVHRAANGREALALLDEGIAPEMIFCDLQMPDMDGVELIRALARRRCLARLVLLSAAGSDVLTSVHTMASDYGLRHIDTMAKPVNRQQLERLLAELVVASSSGAEASDGHSQTASPPTLDEVAVALQRGQLQPWFQPQIDAASGAVVAAEALVRWLHPQRGVLTPNLFLPQVARLGQQAVLTAQVLNGALRAAAKWRRDGHEIGVSVNVDAQELSDPHFADRVRGFLETYEWPAPLLTIEVVECSSFAGVGSALESLNRLRLSGVKIAIDDFGTGYNSLAQLMVTPYTELKIDRRFVGRMGQCDKHRAVVRLCASFARDMGLKVVAEGVEDEATAADLTALGCDLLQGYLYSPAVSVDRFSALFADCVH